MDHEPHLVGLAIGLVALGLLFACVERLFRSVPGPGWYRRRDVATDLAYWFVTPFASRAISRVAVGLVVLGAVAALGGSLAELRSELAAGRFPALGWPWARTRLAALPFAAQLLLGLLVSDGLSYWMHRAFHRGRLWGLHAVHHASPRLDWLSSVRLHPLNQAGMRVVQAVPLLALGFDPKVFGAVAPFFSFYAILIHANVDWSFGPLRYVIATPRFHRWHHTSEAEGRDTDFAGLFPFWDLLFGTFHMPPGRAPRRFGAGAEPVPAGLWRQLLYPFRRPRPGERLAADLAWRTAQGADGDRTRRP